MCERFNQKTAKLLFDQVSSEMLRTRMRKGQYVVSTIEYAVTNPRALCRVVSILRVKDDGAKLMTVELVDTYDRSNIGFIGTTYNVWVNNFEVTTKKGWQLIKAVRRG